MNIINITGEIGWDVTPDDVKKQLAEAKGKDIEVHVASPGGFVFDGIEIFNAFRDYKKQYPKAQMMLTIKGLAASMASYLAVNPAFDLVAAEDNAVFMIHNAWGGAVGDYREMKKSAEVLEGISDLLGQAYAKKTGKDKTEIKKAMDDESWYFGSEILENGFVDDIIKAPEKIEKEKAVASGRVSFNAMNIKLNEHKTDIQKLAAVLKPETEIPVSDSANPAMRDNITEVSKMSLKEMLDQNPAAKIEYENALKEAKTAGYEKGKAEMIEISSKAANFASNKEYPEQIHAVAIDVMQGKKSMETLDTLVANADMIKEMLKSKHADSEQPKGGHGEEPKGEDDETKFKAEVARTKVALGLEVN